MVQHTLELQPAYAYFDTVPIYPLHADNLPELAKTEMSTPEILVGTEAHELSSTHGNIIEITALQAVQDTVTVPTGSNSLFGAIKRRTDWLINPLRDDIGEKSGRERAEAIALTLGTVALTAINASHARQFISVPLELQATQATNPAVGALVGAAIHWGWYMPYGHVLRKTYAAVPSTLAALGDKLHAEKLETLPGLAPGSTMAPSEDPLSKRLIKRAQLRTQRFYGTKAASIGIYLTLAALQKQPKEAQRKLCTEATNEGTVSSYLHTLLFTGSVALLGTVDKGLTQNIVGVAHSPEGVLGLTFAPLLAMTGLRRMRRQRHNEEAARATLLEEEPEISSDPIQGDTPKRYRRIRYTAAERAGI